MQGQKYMDITGHRNGSNNRSPGTRKDRGSPAAIGLLSRQVAFLCAAIIAIGLIAGAACAESNPEDLTTFGRNVYVSKVTCDPAVFFTGDSGTIAIYVTNGNANQSVTVNHATYGDNDIRLTSGTYDSSSTIGPLQTRPFTFSVIARGLDGTYYPRFSLSYFGTNTLWQQEPVQIENTPLVLIVVNKPDTFVEGRKDVVDVQIANPRKNDVKSVILSVSGDGAAITPSKVFIGTLASGSSITTNFTVTPDLQTELTLHLDYNNGDNIHAVTTSLPITFADDKKQANPVLSNIKVTMTTGVYEVTGDVTNAGLLTANGVTVTPLSPAVPQDPYRRYVVGVLKPDDFGSFELTFSADGTTNVPIQLSYKDKDGNVITSQQQISLTGAISSDAETAQPGIFPVIAVVLIIALACGGYLYLKKRKSQ